jgi:hypothetical protein
MSTLQVNTIFPYSGSTLNVSGTFVEASENLIANRSITSSGDLRFPDMGDGVVNPVINISASGTSSLNPNGNNFTNTSTYLNYGVNVITFANSQSYCVRLPLTPTKGKEVTVVNNSGMNIHLFPGSTSGSLNGLINNDITIPSNGTAYKFVCWENPLPGGWSLVSTGTTNVVNSGVIGGILISASMPAAGGFAWWDELPMVNDAMYLYSGEGSSGFTGYSRNYFPQTNPNNYFIQPIATVGTALITISPNNWYTHISDPSEFWLKINTITIYTNFSASNVQSNNYAQFISPHTNGLASIRFAGSFYVTPYIAGTTEYVELYDPGTVALYNSDFTSTAALTNFNNTQLLDFAHNTLEIDPYWDPTIWAGGGIMSYSNQRLLTVNNVPGTFTPVDPSYVPISEMDFTGDLAANVGDPGTTYYTYNLSNMTTADPYFSFITKGIGSYIVDTISATNDNGVSGVYDMRWNGGFGVIPIFYTPVYINGLQLQMVIEYTPI